MYSFFITSSTHSFQHQGLLVAWSWYSCQNGVHSLYGEAERLDTAFNHPQVSGWGPQKDKAHRGWCIPPLFSFLPHLPLYWPEWSLERTDWSNRTPNPRVSAELLTVLWWCHKSQSKHYGLHLNTQIIPFVCRRMNNMQFNLHGSACLAAALCSPYSNCEGCAVRSLLLCRVLQPTVTFQQTWVKRQMKSSQIPIVCSSYCLLKSHQAPSLCQLLKVVT